MPGVSLAANGTEINLLNVTTTTGDFARLDRATDATSTGPSGTNNEVSKNANSSVGINYSLLGNVNTVSGNPALAIYAAANGIRPGNANLGLNINASSGIGLRIPAAGNTDPSAGPTDYSLVGTSINNAAQANFWQTPVDPLVLDLSGDGVRLTSFADAPVLFDADNDGGSLEQTGWVSAQDGIVVHDLNGDGKINNISETLSEFYNGVAGSNGNAGTKSFANGFAALKSLDSNGDNQFTAADAAWVQLRVWQDANHDGKTDAGELQTFTQLGITSINLSAVAQSGEVRDGNEVLSRGTFVQNGLTKEAVAANFLANPSGSTITQQGSGRLVSTEGQNGSAAVRAYVSQNTNAGVGETLNAATLTARNITGGAGNDTITGDANGNWLAGASGADALSAGAGDDVLLFDAADTLVDGGDGFDVAQVLGNQGVTLNLSTSNIEMAVGGNGNDVFIGGGRSTVFVRGGAGDDLIVGGAANDVLSGEDGDDVIDGGAGNDLLRGHRGRDTIMGGVGDDVLDGGLEDDNLSGGTGNDVLTGGAGDDLIQGGDGIDVAEFSGSYADYRVTKLSDGTGRNVFRVVDTRTGRDGADTISDIEKLSFSDVSKIDLTLGSPLPVKDIVSVNSTGQALSRTAAHLIGKAQLLGNDRDWDSASNELSITEVLEARGGTVALTAQGDVLFTPDSTYTGVMSFKYKVKDAQNNVSNVVSDGVTVAMKAAVYLQTPDLPVDPLAMQQWYLSDINVLPVWADYTGKGVRIGQFEPGGAFSVGPEVFDYRHADLQANVDKAWLNEVVADPTRAAAQTFSNHATMVAGVMVAARNGEGGVGVAYNASLAGHYIQGEGLEVTALNQEITNALAKFKNFDVVNNSWGATDNFTLNVVPVGLLETGIMNAITTGRNGLGTAIVMAGGNDRATGANTNYNALTANRAVITTGSINAPGDLGSLQFGSKPFSNPGASILVSAPGSNIDSSSRELISDNGSTFGGNYNTSQGTSFAAPIVSGVVALMLEANPKLGYRDIQTILAMSATRIEDPNGTDWNYNTAKNWNGGGMHTSHDYGFGKVDARAAVRLAETWSDQSTAFNEQSRSAASGTLNVAIPDGAGLYTSTLGMAAGLEVESAQVSITLDHTHWGDLIIKLISPTGTQSVLMDRPGKAPGSAATDLGDNGMGSLAFSFNTTHVRGEASAGNWTLQVIDAATGSVGTLKTWKLDLYGATADSNDVYVYTNEFAATAGRTTLADSNGGNDILNASAVSGNSVLNLANGSTSTIAGKALTVSGDIEAAYGGDGNDTLTGNALMNVLLGGRGNDALSGGAGDDRIEGGSGSDQLSGGGDNDLFVIRNDAGSTDTITDFSFAALEEKIAVVGFGDGYGFSNLTVAAEGANTRVNLGGGQSLILLNTAPAQVTEQAFVFLRNADDLENYVGFWGVENGAIGTSGNENGVLSNIVNGTPVTNFEFYAGAGNDLIGSRIASELIDGGDGNDTLYGEYIDIPGGFTDIAGGNDWLEGGSGNDYLSGGKGNDQLAGGTGDDQLLGGVGNDVLLGGAGVDYLSGDGGNDWLELDRDQGTVSVGQSGYMGTRTGGTGADIFRLASGTASTVSAQLYSNALVSQNLIADFNAAEGDRIDLSAISSIKGFSDLQFVTLSADGRQSTLVYAGQLSGLSSINGALTLSGSALVALTLYGVTPAQLTASQFIFAQQQAGTVYGTASNDVLTGDAGANLMDGLAGADSMTGRTGDDTYVVDNALDQALELPGGGYDTVQSSVSYTLGSDVEALVLTSSADINATGNAGRNRLVGNAGNNRLDGLAEADDMLGGAGNDVYVIGSQLDRATESANEGTDSVESSVSWTLGANFENLSLKGAGNINATGNDAANTLTGNASDNILDGAQGADLLAGGLGNDTYYMDSAGDVITETADAGFDSVNSSVNLTLAANVENGALFGAATSLTGNALDNTLAGNALANALAGGAGSDQLDGGAGADTMAGGTGDDLYFVDVAGDVITELAGEGVDSVVSSVSYTLSADVENLMLTGTAALSGTGNALANNLLGNLAANTLDGAGGADTMTGGAGDDVYYVDSSDTIIENVNEGNDLVYSSVSYVLAANVEKLTLTGDAAINGTGNALDNILTGNSSYNVLAGGAGDDTYYVGSGDTVNELAGGGTDTVYSSYTHRLRANVEKLVLIGSFKVNGDGNDLNNMFWGNSAANRFAGGRGNDSYFLGASDSTNEKFGEGLDGVFVDFSYTLGNNVEYLTLLGTGNINATGNQLDNILIGNSGANVLNGAGGSSSDNDILMGGAGNDTYLLGRYSGVDTVQEADGTAGNTDIALFDSSVAANQLWFAQMGNNLEVSVIGTGSKSVFKDWYSGSQNHVEQFKTISGAKTLLDSQVQNLVSAMAGFAPPAMGQTTLPINYAASLDSVIAANWQ